MEPKGGPDAGSDTPARAEERTDEKPAAAVPTPPPRPGGLGRETAGAGSDIHGSNTPEEDDACRERLTKLGVRFEPLPAIADGQCVAPRPLLVSRLSDGVGVSPPATLACAVVEALARWVGEVAGPEADRLLQARPTRVAIGTSYECRTQNRRSGAKLSEHAFANGIDVSGFEFDKRAALSIGDHPADSPESGFQSAIRTGACTYFTTVLGPGSDPSHATHLHLDLRGRHKAYRICQ